MRERLARWIASAIPTGLTLPILRGPLRGRRWVIGAAAGAGKGISILFSGSERREMEALNALARGGVAFDLGANVGLYSLLLARRCRHVYAFEPMPRNVRFLARTLAANRVRNVTVVPWAVGEEFGMAALAEGDNCALGALDPGGAQPAVVVSVDEFAERYGVLPSVLKVDVEGAEAAVLRGARRVLVEARPLVLLSTHGREVEAECLRLMRAAGYPAPKRLASDPRTGGASLLYLPSAGAERAVLVEVGAASG